MNLTVQLCPFIMWTVDYTNDTVLKVALPVCHGDRAASTYVFARLFVVTHNLPGSYYNYYS